MTNSTQVITNSQEVEKEQIKGRETPQLGATQQLLVHGAHESCWMQVWRCHPWQRNKNSLVRDFAGGPVVKTVSTAGGFGSIPGQGSSAYLAVCQKIK